MSELAPGLGFATVVLFIAALGPALDGDYVPIVTVSGLMLIIWTTVFFADRHHRTGNR